MKTTLVGCTGFVGGNLAAAHSFDAAYHSTDIEQSFGANNGLVVYSGMPAEKFTAAASPDADLALAKQALANMKRMNPERLVLISTVDVYPRPRGVAEDTRPDADTPGFAAYGKNRLALENWVREAWPDALIVRLPGLFGKGLKKNFIHDMLTLTPGALNEARYRELAETEPLVQSAYAPGAGGYYRLQPLKAAQAARLRAFFEGSAFNALSFTDSRSVFQFYNLADLWKDIKRALDKGLRLLNLATELPEVEHLDVQNVSNTL